MMGSLGSGLAPRVEPLVQAMDQAPTTLGEGSRCRIRGTPYRRRNDAKHPCWVREFWYRASLSVQAGIEGDVRPSNEDPAWVEAITGTAGISVVGGDRVEFDEGDGSSLSRVRFDGVTGNDLWFQGYFQRTVNGGLTAVVNLQDGQRNCGIVYDDIDHRFELNGTALRNVEVEAEERFIEVRKDAQDRGVVYVDHERSPIIDGDVVTSTTSTVFRAGAFNDTPTGKTTYRLCLYGSLD